MASTSSEGSQETRLASREVEPETRDDKIANWRNKLIDHYTEELYGIQIIPEGQGTEKNRDILKRAQLDDIYAKPRMQIIKPEPVKPYIYSYKHLFALGNRVFMSSCNGMGKTTFAKKMALTWCQAWQDGLKTDSESEPNDPEYMKEHFELLFFIEREKTETSKLDIVETNLKVFYPCQSEDNDASKEIKEILKVRSCLLILDDFGGGALEETLNQYCTNEFENLTILATSRSNAAPEMAKLHVELSYLTRTASQQLQKNVIRYFHSLYGETSSECKLQEDTDAFDDIISRTNLGRFRYIPEFLIQELWLWKSRKPNKNIFEAYRYRIEQMLVKAHTEGRFRILRDPEVPDYIEGATNFGVFYRHFLNLGEIAFEMLCKQLTGSSEREKNKLSRRDFQFFVKLGILSPDRYRLEPKQFLFSEGTMQELFSALFIAGEWNNLNKKEKIVQKFLGLPDVMKMSSVMNFIKDMDCKRYEDIYNTVVNRADLDMYLEGFQKEGMDVRVYGGRFLQFKEGEIGMVVRDCKTEMANGDFKCCKLEKKYGIFAVKKLELVAKDRKEILEKIEEERLASRFLHPFLLSTMTILRRVSGETQTFYFLSPFCEYASLYEVLYETGTVELKLTERVRIMLQVALAIEYLHRNSRRPMENELLSKKVLIDGKKNARLLHCSITQGTGKAADYKRFGVVIGELLTNRKPDLEPDGYLESLRNDNLFECPEVWKEDKENFDSILELAHKCCKADDSFSLQSHVIESLHNILYQSGNTVTRSDGRCALCMINSDNAARQSHKTTCSETMTVCVSCQHSLYSSPLKCCRCGHEQQRAVGRGWMALLVAGDDEDKDFAGAFEKDVDDMKKLLTFTSPPIFGISKENVKVVKPKVRENNEVVKPKVQEDNAMLKDLETAVYELKNLAEQNKKKEHEQQKDNGQIEDCQTLIVYFSCHGIVPENKKESFLFKLGIGTDLLKLCKLQELLNSLDIQRIIIFIDSCQPPEVVLREGIIKIQINACKPDEKSDAKASGSLFTRRFLEAVVEIALKYPRSDYPWFTGVGLLKHCTHVIGTDSVMKTPAFYSPGPTQYEDLKIGYRFSEPVQVTFYLSTQKETIPVHRSKLELERELFLSFSKSKAKYSVTIIAETITGPLEGRTRICSKIEDVIMAHILEEKLTVDFKELPALQKTKTVRILSKRREKSDMMVCINTNECTL